MKKNIKENYRQEIKTIVIVLLLTMIFYVFEVLDVFTLLRHFCLMPLAVSPLNGNYNVDVIGVVPSIIRTCSFGVILLCISMSFTRFRKTGNVIYLCIPFFVIFWYFLVFMMLFIIFRNGLMNIG